MPDTAAWSRQFLQLCGGELPDDYLVMDCETTGLNEDDLPVQIGHVTVRDRKVVQQGAYWLDWTQAGIPRQWLEDRLDRVETAMMERDGRRRGYFDHMLNDGIDPNKVMQFYTCLVAANAASGGWLVGHNILQYDLQRLRRAAQILPDCTWWPPDKILDTGSLEKGMAARTPMQNGDLIRYQMQLIGDRSNRVRWSLSHLTTKYELEEKAGVDKGQLHGAQYDSLVTHLVLEAQRCVLESACTVGEVCT